LKVQNNKGAEEKRKPIIIIIKRREKIMGTMERNI